MNFTQENYCKYIGSVGIAKSCDIILLDNFKTIKITELENIKDNDLIYIKLDKIPFFSKIIKNIKVKFVLMSGCSDYTTPTDLFESTNDFLNFIESENIIHWFIQNCIVKHEKITLLPIGLDYHTMSERNMEWGNIKLDIS